MNPQPGLIYVIRFEILELLHDLTRHHGRTVVVVLHDLNFAVNYGDTLIFFTPGESGACVE